MIGLAEIAGPIACLGLAVLLLARTRRNRIAGLGYAGVGTILLAASLAPSDAADGAIRLRNCPFHQLAAEHRDLVCGMNLALIEGLVAGLGANDLQPALDPQPEHCCVVIGSGDRSEDTQGAETS